MSITSLPQPWRVADATFVEVELRQASDNSAMRKSFHADGKKCIRTKMDRDNSSGNKRLVSRVCWIPVGYQDVGDAYFLHEGFENLGKLMTTLQELHESDVATERIFKIARRHPGFECMESEWEYSGPPVDLKMFGETFTEDFWFLWNRGGYTYEILDCDFPEEDPTTDRLFIDLEKRDEILAKVDAFLTDLRSLIPET
jgi:hypothetical protein